MHREKKTRGGDKTTTAGVKKKDGGNELMFVWLEQLASVFLALGLFIL